MGKTDSSPELTEEQKAALISGYSSGGIAEENKDLFGKKPKVKPTTFSRPPVVVKPPGVQVPRNWFPKGRVSGSGE